MTLRNYGTRNSERLYIGDIQRAPPSDGHSSKEKKKSNDDSIDNANRGCKSTMQSWTIMTMHYLGRHH